jgi:hypothetical protein
VGVSGAAVAVAVGVGGTGVAVGGIRVVVAVGVAVGGTGVPVAVAVRVGRAARVIASRRAVYVGAGGNAALSPWMARISAASTATMVIRVFLLTASSSLTLPRCPSGSHFTYRSWDSPGNALFGNCR